MKMDCAIAVCSDTSSESITPLQPYGAPMLVDLGHLVHSGAAAPAEALETTQKKEKV